MKRKATIDLIRYCDRENRETWSEFCTAMLKKYGFGDTIMKKILKAASDDQLTVYENRLEKKEDLDRAGVDYE